MRSVLNKLIFLTIFLSGICSWACAHFPLSYKGTITEGKKEAFVFHDGKNAHLIIRTDFSAKKLPAESPKVHSFLTLPIEPEMTEKLPSEIAWVLPFPSLPIKYEEIDGKIFWELYSLSPAPKTEGAESAMSPRQAVAAAGAGESLSGLKIHKTVIAGNYQIQPIEITKDDGTTEFNTWLSKNSFNPMPYENQKYYLKKGAVFLAIRMKTSGLEKIEIKPLHVVYPSDKVSVPIKFSHDQRTFDLDIYVFSEIDLWNKAKKLGEEKVYPSFSEAYLFFKGSGPYSKTEDNPILGTLLGNRKGFITRFEAVNLNYPGYPIKKIVSDPTFLASELNLKK